MAKTQPQKANGWLKFLRVVIYAVTIVGVAIGAGLIKNANLSSSYADGTSDAKLANGLPIFFTSLTLLFTNIFWGILRWFLRGYREDWRAKQIIGKLIGGGLWRTLAVVPFFMVSLLALTPSLSDAISKNVAIEAENFTPYNPSIIFDRLQHLNGHLSEYNKEDAIAAYNELTLSNINFDPDYVTTPVSHYLFTQNVSATTQKVSTLTKAELSPKENFVIFYTTQGDDAITDDQAAKLAEMLEDVIASYWSNLGFQYSYEKIGVGILKDADIKKVLKSSNIDQDILNTVMPVYVANPYTEDTGVLASYAGRRFADLGTSILVSLGALFGEETARLYDSAPSYPFINILPSNVSNASLASVIAHELGHHYSAIYNQEIYGKTGSDDDFIDETGPNWMAVNVINGPVDGVINGGHYNRSYLAKGTDYTVSSAVANFEGYPPLAFLQNYYEIVQNSKTKIMDAIYYGDALQYLYDQAGKDNFAKVMTALAEKNLTGDYGGVLANYITPKGKTLSCTDVCSNYYKIAPAATSYVYFSPAEYAETEITFKSYSPITASFIGKNMSGDWQIIAPASSESTIEITEDFISQYEVVAIAASNPSISNANFYDVSVAKTAFKEFLDPSSEYHINFPSEDAVTYLGGGCYHLNTQAFFEYLNQFVNLGSFFLTSLSQFDNSGQIETIKTEYIDSTSEARKNLDEANSALAPYDITFCANYVNKEYSFAAAKQKLQSGLPYSVNLYDGQDGKDRISIFTSFDLLSREARLYLLTGSDHDLGFISANVRPK